MPTRLKPIPDAVWLRLAALDTRCNISMRREDQWMARGAGGRLTWSGFADSALGHRRVWSVRIFPKGKFEIHDIIDAQEPHLCDALEVVISEAERRGWNRAA